MNCWDMCKHICRRCVEKAPKLQGKTQSSSNPLENSEPVMSKVRNSAFSKLAAQVMEGMKFKSLVLPSPAAFELSKNFRTPFFFTPQFILHHNPRQYRHVKDDFRL